MSEQDDTYRHQVPMNELDAQMMTVNTEWGGSIAPELKKKLQAIGEKGGKAEVGTDGVMKIDAEQLWGLLSFYTRDIRLGNLDKETYPICCEWLTYAGDCLTFNFPKTFLTALSRVITMLELSQSKGGFLRKRLGTFTQEHYNEFNENSQKKGLFGSKNKR